jgi:hypothetical protein
MQPDLITMADADDAAIDRLARAGRARRLCLPMLARRSCALPSLPSLPPPSLPSPTAALAPLTR